MGMTIEEVITRYKNNAEYERTHGNLQGCLEFRQLAEWLKELKQLREQTRWIPVSERLPRELEPVNVTWVNHNPESYYGDIKDKPFTATGVYFNRQWYWWSTLCTDILAEYSHNYDDIIDDDIPCTNIPFLLHKEFGCPLDECVKAYEKANEYLRSKSKLKG